MNTADFSRCDNCSDFDYLAADGLCHTCHRNARRNARRAAMYRWQRIAKISRGCENPSCVLVANGVTVQPWHLDWDHIEPSDKRNEIVNLIGRDCSPATVRAEMEKCRVLCKICHADHTHQQKYA